MTKPPDRWPIWKIAVTTAGCAAGAAALYGLSVLAESAVGEPPEGPYGRKPALTLPGFVMMLATGAGILSVLGIIWLVFRIREARMPAWKRPGRKKRR
jgi:hypothetical protein